VTARRQLQAGLANRPCAGASDPARSARRRRPAGRAARGWTGRRRSTTLRSMRSLLHRPSWRLVRAGRLGRPARTSRLRSPLAGSSFHVRAPRRPCSSHACARLACDRAW